MTHTVVAACAPSYMTHTVVAACALVEPHVHGPGGVAEQDDGHHQHRGGPRYPDQATQTMFLFSSPEPK